MRKNTRQENLRNMQRLNSAWGREPSNSDWFFDKWENDFDRTAKRTMRGILAVWVLSIIGCLIFWGVVIWGIIELVQWVKAQ